MVAVGGVGGGRWAVGGGRWAVDGGRRAVVVGLMLVVKNTKRKQQSPVSHRRNDKVMKTKILAEDAPADDDCIDGTCDGIC